MLDESLPEYIFVYFGARREVLHYRSLDTDTAHGATADSGENVELGCSNDAVQSPRPARLDHREWRSSTTTTGAACPGNIFRDQKIKASALSITVMMSITEDRLFAIIVYAAVGLLLVRLWEWFVGQSRVVSYVFDAGVAVIFFSVLGVVYLRLQKYVTA